MNTNLAFAAVLFAGAAYAQGQARITLDQAIDLALRHNHSLKAARTQILQNQGDEITAGLRPNPEFFAEWDYLPVFSRPSVGLGPYLQSSTEGDLGFNYTIERGQKRARRMQAARDTTAVTRSQVADNERTTTYDVASGFISVQLAESTLDLAEQNLKSFQRTVDIGESQFKAGGISENDLLKIKLQMLQFQTDVQNARLSRVQALADLRQKLGYESVPADYDVLGGFEHQPKLLLLPELQQAALANRPDLRAAQLGITSANSQYALAKANAKGDLSFSANYAHNGGLNTSTFGVSIPLQIFNRNQGEIAKTRHAMTQAEEEHLETRSQVQTDVRDAYESLQTNEKVLQFYTSGYLDISRRNRDISEYAYQRGAATLLDFLDAERNYRSTELGYRQAVAACLTAIEQLRQAVGSRNLP